MCPVTSDKNPHAFELQETSYISNRAQSWSFKGPGLCNLLMWQKWQLHGGGEEAEWKASDHYMASAVGKSVWPLPWLTSSTADWQQALSNGIFSGDGRYLKQIAPREKNSIHLIRKLINPYLCLAQCLLLLKGDLESLLLFVSVLLLVVGTTTDYMEQLIKCSCLA